MTRIFLGLILVAGLVGGGATLSVAGDMGYSLKGAEEGFTQAVPERPSTSVLMADAAVARPIGLIGTLMGTTLFVATLPFSVPSGSVCSASRAVTEPGSWTFVRPLGQSDPGYEDSGLFSPYRP